MAKSNVGQKGTKTSSHKNTSKAKKPTAKTKNTNSASCMFLVDPFILCAAIIAIIRRPQRIKALIGTPYAMLRYAIANQVLKFVNDYKQYFVNKYGEGHAYSSFDANKVTDSIVGLMLAEAMQLSVDTFMDAVAKYEAEGMANSSRSYLDSADVIEEAFNSSVKRGEVYFRPHDCEPLVRITESREVSSALQAACIQLSAYMANNVPALISSFHKKNSDKNARPLKVDMDGAVRYAAANYKPGVVVEKNCSKAFSALAYTHESGDITIMQLFRAYFQANTGPMP